MARLGLADSSTDDGGPQTFGGGYDITSRLSRSATIALLASPVGLLIISIARLLIISDYNPVTASAIVSSGGYVDALLGSLIPLVPILLPYLALLLLFFNRVILGTIGLLSSLVISPASVSSNGALHILEREWSKIEHARPPVVIAMIVLALIAAVLLICSLGLVKDFARALAAVVCILLIPLVLRVYPFPFNREFYTELISRPWLPAETITMESGQKVIGYVLSDGGTWLVVLQDSNRRIYYYPAGKVASLQVCQLGKALPTTPLVTVVSAGRGSSQTPSCAALSEAEATSGAGMVGQ